MIKSKKSKIIKIILIIFISIIAMILLYPLIPQSKKLPKITKINNLTYNFQDGASNSCSYLLIGDEKALLIDTGLGVSKLDEAIKQITDLPIIVVNTHGHFDHVGNNKLFKEIYMNEKDFELYKYYCQEDAIDWVYGEVPKVLRYFLHQELKIAREIEPVPVKALPEEGYFNLGNRIISFFETPGHTPGSICLYDEKNNMLFTGDSAAEAGLLLQLPMSLSPETYLDSAKVMNQFIMERNIEIIYPGHASIGISSDIISNYEKACNDLVQGTVSEEIMKTGYYSAYGVTVSFDPDCIHKSDEK